MFRLAKASLAFPNLACMSFCDALPLLIRLPRYVKLLTYNNGLLLTVTGALGIEINAHNFVLEWTDDVQAHLHGKAVQYVCLTESKTKRDHGDRSILARRDLPLEEFAREFSGLAVWTGLDDAMLNSLLWIGANSHRSMDLPDTTGLSWREGILRCLESVDPRSRTSLPSRPSAVL